MIRYTRRGIEFGELWFDAALALEPDIDILLLRNRPAPDPGGSCTVFHTLTHDLTLDETRLFALLGSTNRYEVKRAANRDGLAYGFFAEPEMHLDAFCRFFDEFADQKSLVPSARDELIAACNAGQLVLSLVTRHDAALVWHAYITGTGTAFLLHSASHYRSLDASDRAVIGRANRWAHWRDMLAFKGLGFRCYDWGGMFEDETDRERAGINGFKREFGGTARRNYNCEVPISAAGRAYVLARSAYRKIREMV